MHYVAVVGPAEAGDAEVAAAEEVGRLLAEAGVLVVTGGLGGVMAAASRGAAAAGGTVLGLLPGTDRAAANESVTVVVPTGLGQARNALVVRTADALVAVGGSWGTLSEVALARRLGRPVLVVGGWSIKDASGAPVADGPQQAATPREAVTAVLAALA